MPTNQLCMFPVLVVGLLGAFGAWQAQSVRTTDDAAYDKEGPLAAPASGAPAHAAAAGGYGDDTAPSRQARPPAAPAHGALAHVAEAASHGDDQEDCHPFQVSITPEQATELGFAHELGELRSNTTECSGEEPESPPSNPPECNQNFEDEDARRYLDFGGGRYLMDEDYVVLHPGHCMSRADLIDNRGPPLFTPWQEPVTEEEFTNMKKLMKDQPFWPFQQPGTHLANENERPQFQAQLQLSRKVFGDVGTIMNKDFETHLQPVLLQKCSGGVTSIEILARLLPGLSGVSVVSYKKTGNEFTAEITAQREKGFSLNRPYEDKVKNLCGRDAHFYVEAMAFITKLAKSKQAADVEIKGEPGRVTEMRFSDPRPGGLSLTWTCSKPRPGIGQIAGIVGVRCRRGVTKVIVNLAGGCARPRVQE